VSDNKDAEIRQIRDLIKQIKPLLAGKGPGVQGAVLAWLTAMWVSGHPHDCWHMLIKLHLDTLATQLIELRSQSSAPAPEKKTLDS